MNGVKKRRRRRSNRAPQPPLPQQNSQPPALDGAEENNGKQLVTQAPAELPWSLPLSLPQSASSGEGSANEEEQEEIETLAEDVEEDNDEDDLSSMELAAPPVIAAEDIISEPSDVGSLKRGAVRSPTPIYASVPCTSFSRSPGRALRLHSAQGPLLVLGMNHGEHVCFIGSARLSCLEGQITVGGYALRVGEYVAVHSPRWMSALVARCEEGVGQAALDLDLGRVHKQAKPVADEDCVLRAAKGLVEAGAQGVLVCRTHSESPNDFLGPGHDADVLYARNSSRTSLDSDPVGLHGGESPQALADILRLPGFQIVLDDLGAAGVMPLSIPTEWIRAVDSAFPSSKISHMNAPAPSVVVCGAKGVGKSTLCRYLVNRLLRSYNQVALLDSDVGQPELTPPGLVSLSLVHEPLLAPPHMNMMCSARHLAMYYVGAHSPKQEPLLYSSCAGAAAEEYKKHCFGSISDPRSIPLVVNTLGWVKGMGEDLLWAVIRAVSPRCVIKLEGDTSAKCFRLGNLDQDCKIHSVPAWFKSSATGIGAPGGADLRTLRLAAYFMKGVSFPRQLHLRLPVVRSGVLCDPDCSVAAALASHVPYAAPLSKLTMQVVGNTDTSLSMDQLLRAMNGSLVGLHVADSQAVGHPLCVGLGIVRAIDSLEGKIYLLTPVDPVLLARCNLLSKGSLHLPTSLLFDSGSCRHPYLLGEAVTGVGGDAIRSRTNLKRKGHGAA